MYCKTNVICRVADGGVARDGQFLMYCKLMLLRAGLLLEGVARDGQFILNVL